MCSLCRLPVAKNHNFGQILTFGGSCTGSFLPISVKFGVLKQTGRLHLRAKFHLKVFIVSASSGQKPQFWANSDFLGGSCTDPLLPMRAKSGVLQLTHSTRLHVKILLDRFILSSLGGEKPHFLPFFDFGI